MKTREEISINDLNAVVQATKLLRTYGLISAAKGREIDAAVIQDVHVHMDRYQGDDTMQRVANEAYRAVGSA